VDATLARVEAAGGTRLFDEVTPWGTARVIYVTDLDGNVLELLDAPLEVIVREAVRLFPQAAVADDAIA
jgi:predicted lactoylglutathione lyase